MSQSGWLGPRDAWPVHSRPLAQRALKELRQAGWFLKKASAGAKGWGVVTCADPTLYGPETRCSSFVSSTSGPPDGSETAKVLDSLRKKCSHDHPSPDPTGEPDETSVVDQAVALIDGAEAAVTAAEHLLASGSHQDLVEDFFAQAQADVADAERLLNLAIEHEAIAADELEVAEAAAKASGASVSLGVDGLTGRAIVQVEQAEVIVLRRTGPTAAQLRARCNEVRHRARALDV